jgi:rhodanese-related sulfurtransferase
MSPNSAGKAEKLGYTNVKVYHEGLPEWSKNSYSILVPQFLKEAFIDKEIPTVLLDVRRAKEAGKGFIKGAVSLPAADVEKALAKFPAKELKPPVIIYSDKSGDDAVKTAKALVKAGYKNTKIVTGGYAAWLEAKFPVETGNLNTVIAYAPKPRPGEISFADFTRIAKTTAPDVLILDVRNQDEGNSGMIKGAKLVPDEELLARLAELPKDKLIIAHCATGIRAEMAYHKLKEKGYNVKFLNAKVEIDKEGNFKLEKS